MKLLSLLLTVLCVAGVPLTAAALDYGPDQRMLAAEASTPVLPGARGDENPFGPLGAAHRARGDDEATASTATTSDNESHATVRTSHTAAPHVVVPAVGIGPAPNARSRSVLSWQSLLPGSIQ